VSGAARPRGAHEAEAHPPGPGGGAPGAGSDPRAAAGCILVVEDDEAIRRVVALALADEGYGVTVAPDGRAALERLRYHRPRLILLDMRMPEMDGWEFARRYRARPGPYAPIICVTAAVDAAAWGAQIGAAASLGKPFDLDDLLAIVDRYARPARR